MATVGAPHGVRGAVKLTSYASPPEGFASYAQLQCMDGTPVRLTIMGQVKGQFIVEITGVRDRNEAERWRNKTLGVPRSALPKLAEKEGFYHLDLIGLNVVDKDGKACGVVRQVVNFGAGDLLEIEVGGESEFYSFTRANFPHIDRDKRIIEFHKPEILES